MLRRIFGWLHRSSPPPARPRHSTPAPCPQPSATPAGAPDRAPAPSARIEVNEEPKAAAAANGDAPATGDPAEELSPEAALEQELLLTMRERSRVLLYAAPPETQDTDAPAVVDSLVVLGETVIRQPPVAAQKVLAAVRDPLCPTNDFVPLFERDPALTRGLLRMANSAFYRRGTDPCLAISDAVQLIGLRGVECVVTQSMVHGMLCRPGGLYMGMVNDAWAHMTRTAPLARRLSAAFVVQPEAAFTMGLLHDVGKLVVFDHVSALRTKFQREPVLPAAFLTSLLGRLHEPLGGIAALRWGLGLDVARAIAGHHREPPPARPLLITELLYVAELVDHATRTGTPIRLDRVWSDGDLSANLVDVRLLLGLPETGRGHVRVPESEEGEPLAA